MSVVGGSHAKEIGDILAYEEDDDVYGVELSSGHARVKRADLLPRYDVTVLELDGKPVIKKGTVDGWHAESERYEVALRDLQTPRACPPAARAADRRAPGCTTSSRGAPPPRP